MELSPAAPGLQPQVLPRVCYLPRGAARPVTRANGLSWGQHGVGAERERKGRENSRQGGRVWLHPASVIPCSPEHGAARAKAGATTVSLVRGAHAGGARLQDERDAMHGVRAKLTSSCRCFAWQGWVLQIHAGQRMTPSPVPGLRQLPGPGRGWTALWRPWGGSSGQAAWLLICCMRQWRSLHVPAHLNRAGQKQRVQGRAPNQPSAGLPAPAWLGGLLGPLRCSASWRRGWELICGRRGSAQSLGTAFLSVPCKKAREGVKEHWSPWCSGESTLQCRGDTGQAFPSSPEPGRFGSGCPGPRKGEETVESKACV